MSVSILHKNNIQVDILNQRNLITNVIADIEATLTVSETIDSLLDCLSQTLSLEGPFKNACIGELRNRIFQLAKSNPVEAKTVIKNARYKDTPVLSDVVKKVDYLASGYWTCVGHHLKDSYANNKRYGVNYFTTGLVLMLGYGLQKVFTDNSEEDLGSEKNIVPWTMFSLGVSLSLFAVGNSLRLAAGDEP